MEKNERSQMRLRGNMLFYTELKRLMDAGLAEEADLIVDYTAINSAAFYFFDKLTEHQGGVFGSYDAKIMAQALWSVQNYDGFIIDESIKMYRTLKEADNG